jgi:glycosyltransferase involved in cell wall biosynthesis
LRAAIVRHDVEDCVEITGWLPAAEGLKRCANALAGLSPIPRTELLEYGSPTKVVEYFSLGLPVIANDQPDQARLLRAAGGTCTPLTPEGFADAMQDVLARPEHHRAVAAAGQALVRRERSYSALAAQVAQQLRRTVQHG